MTDNRLISSWVKMQAGWFVPDFAFFIGLLHLPLAKLFGAKSSSVRSFAIDHPGCVTKTELPRGGGRPLRDVERGRNDFRKRNNLIYGELGLEKGVILKVSDLLPEALLRIKRTPGTLAELLATAWGQVV